MKIAYIMPQFPVATETFAVSDVNALAALGHEVTVFALKPPTGEAATLRTQVPLAAGVTVAGWRVAPIDMPALIACLRHGMGLALRDFRLGLGALAISLRVAAVVHALRKGGFDVVHAFWSRHPSLVIAALAARRRNGAGPLLSAFAGAYDLVADDALVALGLAHADIRFTHAEVNRPYFVERGFGDVHVVRRGIPVEALAVGEGQADRRRIVTVSALDARKNVEGVIRSFALARARSNAALHLDIVGAGPDEDRLRRIVNELGLADGVRFLGHLSHRDVLARMRAAHTFLFLSHKASERFPNVVKEALYAGCYVVASATPGIGALVCDGVLGEIVPADDSEAAATALLRSMDEPPGRTVRRRRVAARLIARRWSSRRSMQRYASAWKGALADLTGEREP